MQKKLQQKILIWYKKNKRSLPWRKTTDPYKILVSEVMLQQTQVDRVISYHKRWLKKYPDFAALAKSDNRELLKLWSGLGYNNRALRLKKLALEVAEKYNGTLPKDEESLRSLPGIGPYTAHAVMAFAYNKEVPVMDTNIRRVLIHELTLKEDISKDALQNIALELVPKGKSRIWHNALMDYGAMEKTARATGISPLSKQSRFEGSDRWIRGHIVKGLIAHKKLSLKTFQKIFNKKQFNKVLHKLEKEGMITINNKHIVLA